MSRGGPLYLRMVFVPFFFFSWWYWVWIQGLALARQALYHLNHSTSSSSLVFKLLYDPVLAGWTLTCLCLVLLVPVSSVLPQLDSTMPICENTQRKIEIAWPPQRSPPKFPFNTYVWAWHRELMSCCFSRTVHDRVFSILLHDLIIFNNCIIVHEADVPWFSKPFLYY
jgi:hypothetical protein